MWDDAFLQHVGVDANYIDHRTDSFSRKRDAVDAARRELTPHGVAVRFHGALLIREVMSENSSRVIAEAFLDSFRSAPIIDELVRSAAAFAARLYVFLSHFAEFALLCTILGPFVARLAHGGARNDLHALVAVRGVGVQRARVLFDRNVRTAAQLADLTEDKLVEILGVRLGPPEVRAATARSLLQAARQTVEFDRVRAAAANVVSTTVAGAAIAPTAASDPAGLMSVDTSMPPPPPPRPSQSQQPMRKRNVSGASSTSQSLRYF
jgi:hypothetical protein